MSYQTAILCYEWLYTYNYSCQILLQSNDVERKYRAFCDTDLKASSHPHPTTWASSKTHKAESDIVSPTIKSLLLVGNLQTVIV